MGGINFSDESGLYPLRIPVLDLHNLHGHGWVDDDFSAKIAKVDDFLGHCSLLILINL